MICGSGMQVDITHREFFTLTPASLHSSWHDFRDCKEMYYLCIVNVYEL